MITKYYKTPSNGENVLKGILRDTKTLRLKETGHWSFLDSHYILGYNYSLYWHTVEDNSSKQYIELSFHNRIVEVSDYHFNTGNNGQYFSRSWYIDCSMNGKDWTTIDSHSNDAKITSSNQSFILPMQRVDRCTSYKIFFPGRDSLDRGYNYLGLLEFYGKVYVPIITMKKCINKNYYLSIASFIVIGYGS